MKARNLLILITIGILPLAGCGGDDNPAAPTVGVPETPRAIMVLSDGGNEGHISTILADAGFDVRDGGPFQEFDGSGLDSIDAVVLLAGYDYAHDMIDDGEWALTEFVTGGGGLFTTEWLTLRIRGGDNQIIQGLVPVIYDGSGGGYEEYTVMVDHPVTDGLPETFMIPDANEYGYLELKDGATELIRGSATGPALSTWTLGGHVVTWNATGVYGGEDVWSDELDRMIVNAVDFISAPRTGPTIDLAYDTILLEARKITIYNDGDGPPGGGSEGDFYITVRIAADIGGEEIELARQDQVLVQGDDGTVRFLDIDAEVLVPRIDGQRVIARVSYYENDPDGPQQSAGTGMEYVFDEAAGCWYREVEDVCLDSEHYDYGDLFLEDYTGDPLSAKLGWRVSVR